MSSEVTFTLDSTIRSNLLGSPFDNTTDAGNVGMTSTTSTMKTTTATTTEGGVRYDVSGPIATTTITTTTTPKSTLRSKGTTKKRRKEKDLKDLTYEIDKLRKDNQLQKEALQEKDKRIEELNKKLKEIKRLGTRELDEMRRAHVKIQKSNHAYERRIASSVSEQERIKTVSQNKINKLERERRELVKALHAVASHVLKTSNRSSVYVEREEIFPKKVEPWLSLTYDPEALPMRKKSGRRSQFVKPLPFNGSGKVLVSELVSRIDQITSEYSEQKGKIDSLKASMSGMKQELKEKKKEHNGVADVISLMLDEVRQGSHHKFSEDEEGQMKEEAIQLSFLVDNPSTSGYSQTKMLRLISGRMQDLRLTLDKVTKRSKDFETQALELEFYAKLHGKLVQKTLYETMTSPNKTTSPNKMAATS